MKVVFLDRDTIGPGVQLKRPSFEHEWVEYDRTEKQQVDHQPARGGDLGVCERDPDYGQQPHHGRKVAQWVEPAAALGRG